VRYVGQAPANPGGVKLYNAANEAVVQPAAKPAKTSPGPYRGPPSSPVLGPDIDNRPLQTSPADVAWSPPAPAKPVAKAQVAAQPPIGGSVDIDSLLDQLAGR
jgi:hypothetical protein